MSTQSRRHGTGLPNATHRALGTRHQRLPKLSVKTHKAELQTAQPTVMLPLICLRYDVMVSHVGKGIPDAGSVKNE